MISATPVPLMVDLVHNDVWNIDQEDFVMFELEPTDDYVGIEDMVPLKKDGQDVYIAANELNYRSDYSVDGINIGYASEKLITLYDDALMNSDNRQGVLILDCTCPRVKADKNVTEKASAVQELYQEKGIDVTVATIVGRGISVKFPNEEWDHESQKKFKILNLLESIDQKCGLEMPVIVFGWSKMCRGISFRNSKRVPT
jgi:hypothetical protein